MDCETTDLLNIFICLIISSITLCFYLFPDGTPQIFLRWVPGPDGQPRWPQDDELASDELSFSHNGY